MAADEETRTTITPSLVQHKPRQNEHHNVRTPGIGHAWIKFMASIGWYPEDMPEKERRLILKLDLSILIFGCLSFFTKYLDQQSITNAYVRYVFYILFGTFRLLRAYHCW